MDTHIRERLTGLRLHQEELTALAYQIACVGVQLEKSLSVDNAKLVGLQKDSESMIDVVSKQKEQLIQLPNQLNLDARVSISFTKVSQTFPSSAIRHAVVTCAFFSG